MEIAIRSNVVPSAILRFSFLVFCCDNNRILVVVVFVVYGDAAVKQLIRFDVLPYADSAAFDFRIEHGGDDGSQAVALCLERDRHEVFVLESFGYEVETGVGGFDYAHDGFYGVGFFSGCVDDGFVQHGFLLLRFELLVR